MILGDGELRAELEQLSRTLGVADAVTFAGWSREVADWYAASDIVAGTSDNEGTPLALIEAAASGRPVVATRVGGVADVVEDGETGLLVAPNDEEALANGLVELTRHSDLRVRMGASASRRSVRFSGQRLVNDLEALYDQLLTDARPTQPGRQK